MPSHAAAREPAAESKPRYLRLLLSSLVCTGALTYMLFINAQDPKLQSIDAEELAQQALLGIGYSWAKVHVEAGVAHISGEAPGEPERVLAYEQVYKALRPMMTEAKTITHVASHLTLSPEAVALAEPPPPEANFKVPSENLAGWDAKIATPAPDVPAAETEPTRAVATAASQPIVTASVGTPAGVAEGRAPTSSSCKPLERGAHEPPVLAYCPAPTRAAEAPAALATSGAVPLPAVEAAVAAALQASTGMSVAAPPIETSSVERDPAATTGGNTNGTNAPAPSPAVQPAAAAGTAASDCKTSLAGILTRTSLRFASTSAKLGKDSRPALDKLAAAAKACEGPYITVLGYTDGYGSKPYNLVLSRKRAEAVRDALVERGVARARLAVKGLGATSPVARVEAGAPRNRRIEFALSETVPAAAAAAEPRKAAENRKK